MKQITKLLSAMLALSMLITAAPVVSYAATEHTLPHIDEFLTEGYNPAEGSDYTVSSGTFEVHDGILRKMSEDGSKDFLTVDFETVSTGTLVFEVDFWSQYNNMSNGFFFMYDEDGNTVLKLSATSRTANGTYTNEYVKNGDKQLNNSAWGSGATGAVKDMRKFVVKVEVDLGAKKWRVWQNTKQLAYTADPTVNEFDFMIDSDVNISSLKWGIYGKNHGIDNIKIYKKLTASQTVKSYDMLAGDKQQAQINVSPATETIGDLKWVSSDTSVATVDGTGLITAVKEGTANITAESAFYGINYTYAVAVKTPATGLSIDKIESTVCIDDTVTLRAVPSPANTTAGDITWSSSDESIAEVDENGVVKGVGKGTATITATASVAGLSATATVNVLKPLTGLSIAASDTTLAIGDRESFAAVVEPADASEVSKLWRSGNPFVATVDQNGVVTAVGAGTTDIYVSASDFYASKSVTVADASDASDGGKPSLVSFYSPTGYSFSDIADMVWAQAAVYSAVESGAINPDSETVFGAKRNIKRDEFVSVVIKTLGLSNKQGKPEDVEALKSFTDVSEDNPYYAEIMKALELGIIQGVSETEFAPDIDITRQDMAVVVANAFKAASIKTEEGRLDFVDKDSIAEYAQTSVRILAKMGIIVGKGEGYYDPLANTTRAEIAVVVDRITALR